MLILGATATPTGKHTIRIEETCGALVVKVMSPFTMQQMQRYISGQSARLTIAIKNVHSQEKVIAANIPLIVMLQFTQNRKGYWNIIHTPDGTTGSLDAIGLSGMIALSHDGNVNLKPGDWIDLTISDLPTNAKVSIATVDLKGKGNTYVKYSEYNVLGRKRYERQQVAAHHETLLLPIESNISEVDGNTIVDKNNPLQDIQLFFRDGSPDMRLDRNDIIAQNVLKSGNDIVAFWGLDDIDEPANLCTHPVIPSLYNVFAGEMGSMTTGIMSGCYKHGLIDLEDVKQFDINKVSDEDFTYYIEKTKALNSRPDED